MKILLSNLWMKNFGGSELVTLELAEEYQARGWDVLLYSPQFGEPLKSHIKVPTTMAFPDLSEFDIVWNHHDLFTDRWKPRMSQAIVSNHMSSYVAQEFPKNPEWENKNCQFIFANSPETRTKMIQLGLMNVDVFPNPAPERFMPSKSGVMVNQNTNEPFHPEKKYALFVSNHRPTELDIVSRGLDIPIRSVGELNDFLRLTPELLRDAAFVVCNGKTVQYALRAGTPVFLYDQFGGPGWLTNENFAHAAAFNFSGRGFETKVSLSTLSTWREAKPIPFVPLRYKLEYCLSFYGLL